MFVLSVRQRAMLLVIGFALFVVAMGTWPTRATAIANAPIAVPSIAADASPAAVERTEPLHDPFLDYYTEFADPSSATPSPATMSATAPHSGRMPGFQAGGSGVIARQPLDVCLTFGATGSSTIAYAIVEGSQGRRYVTIGDEIDGTRVRAIGVEDVRLADGRVLRRSLSRCSGGSAAGSQPASRRGGAGGPGEGASAAAGAPAQAGNASTASPGPGSPPGVRFVPPTSPSGSRLASPQPGATLTPIDTFGSDSTPAPRTNDIYNPGIDPRTPYLAPGNAPTQSPVGGLSPL